MTDESLPTAPERPPVEPNSIVGGGWKSWVFPALWLVYVGQTASGVGKHSSGVVSVIGYVIIGVFCLLYMAALPTGWHHRFRTFWFCYALAVALTVAEAFIAHEDAFVFCVYLAVLTVAAERRFTAPALVAMTLAATFVPALVPSWHASVSWSNGLTILLVSLAMYGFFHLVKSNRELAAARAEVARLAAETERSRIARDLHDLLGHSLTTITVKAGLARRLAERGEAERAQTEITEVEQLSRRTLGDVRAAVSGHRDVTLAGELATAREVLRAAAIVGELPGSVDVVDPMLSEVFGWVVREGITNIVRHSHAQHCRVTLGPRWIEIADDGVGGGDGCGSGLRGLAERLEAVGGAITSTGGFNGFRLRAEVPAAVVPAAPTAPPAGPVERPQVDA
jgi:two-component system, NarL family, sensor histidine kinase DesK